MQMASVHVGTDTDYSFTNRKDERAALLASRHHGVKAQQRGFLAETTAAHPVAAAAQSYASPMPPSMIAPTGGRLASPVYAAAGKKGGGRASMSLREAGRAMLLV